MGVLLLFIFCALYFLYLKNWADSVLRKEYNFGSPAPPVPLPHSVTLSVVVSTLYGILLLAGVFWGFTYNRYPDHMSIRGDHTEVVLLIVLCAVIGLSYTIVYRLGEMKGVAEMKNTNLFLTAMHRSG